MITAIVYGGKKIEFTSEEVNNCILQCRMDWETMRQADNLPKWIWAKNGCSMPRREMVVLLTNLNSMNATIDVAV